tara:strand:- start:368 stop:493 length:126 start_codon:yes stop_codon:yes gene_type:complete
MYTKKKKVRNNERTNEKIDLATEENDFRDYDAKYLVYLETS